MDLSKDWSVRMAKAKEAQKESYGKEQLVHTLCAISDEKPNFSGLIRYTKEIWLDTVPEKAFFYAEHVYEVMRVQVNGVLAGTCLTPPYQLAVAGLKQGSNQICIEVATTPARDQMNYPMPPFDFSHEALEPTGMFGKILLYMK